MRSPELRLKCQISHTIRLRQKEARSHSAPFQSQGTKQERIKTSSFLYSDIFKVLSPLYPNSREKKRRMNRK
jgi:hypothetical protein